jgi:hypothetical protein
MRLLFRMLGVGLVCSGIALACGGPEFSSSGNKSHAGAGTGATSGASGKGGSGQGGSNAGGDSSLAGSAGVPNGGAPGSGGSAAGSAGTAGGGTTLCTEAKDCADPDPCTIDSCGADGVCVHAPKCTGDQVCCDGVCGQCCSKSDCDDQIDCTDDECFAGFCTNTPGTCPNDNDYCSPTGCVPREGCTVDADCTDDDPCTVDSCVDHLCSHPSCPGGGTCCPGLGCGTCCSDSQCPQTDPCNPSTCGTDLTCSTSSLCASGTRCCPSPDGTTAACGACCEASDCPDDGVACTVEKCKAGADGTLACSSEPDPSLCMTGQTCDPKAGCSSNECKQASDCSAALACQTVACDNGKCDYSNVSCSHSQTCCSTSGMCQDCCSNEECHDASAALCCPDTGTCAQCCTDSDCQVATAQGGETPQAITGGIGVIQCSRPFCNAGVCQIETGKCPLTQKCCAGLGCVGALQSCGVTPD